MKTGDILLCSGNGVLSKAIVAAQCVFAKVNNTPELLKEAVQISHIAGLVHDGKDVSESTTFNKWCNKKGCQINSFVDWINNYDGKVWIREQIVPKNWTYDIAAEIDTRAELYVGRPYENGIPGALELLLAGIEWPWFVNTFHLADKLQTRRPVFCSENWCKILVECSVLLKNPERFRTNKCPPMEWYGNGKFDRFLINRFHYGLPKRIK